MPHERYPLRSTNKLNIETKWNCGSHYFSIFSLCLKSQYFDFEETNMLVCECVAWPRAAGARHGGKWHRWVEIKTNYRFGVLVFRDFIGASSQWGEKMTTGKKKKKKRLDMGSEWWCRRQTRESAPRSVYENQWPLGGQLSSITRRIQLQREAERDTASICHTLTVGKIAGGERDGVGGRETVRNRVRKRDETGEGAS